MIASDQGCAPKPFQLSTQLRPKLALSEPHRKKLPSNRIALALHVQSREHIRKLLMHIALRWLLGRASFLIAPPLSVTFRNAFHIFSRLSLSLLALRD